MSGGVFGTFLVRSVYSFIRSANRPLISNTRCGDFGKVLHADSFAHIFCELAWFDRRSDDAVSARSSCKCAGSVKVVLLAADSSRLDGTSHEKETKCDAVELN